MSATSYIGNYYGNLFLQNYLRAQGAWLGLHTDEPTPLGDTGTELGGVRRQKLTFSPPNAKTIVNNSSAKFTDLIAASLTWLSLWDRQAAGNMIGAFLLTRPITVQDSGQLLIAAGDIAFSL